MYHIVTWFLVEWMVTSNSGAVDCSNLVINEEYFS